jgi:succinyl-CoA synthetase alpha subunit
MSILVDSTTRVIFQGLTGATASRMAERAIAQGTRVVGGVTPGKGGTTHLDVPVFDTVAEAVAEVQPDASAVFVPPQNAAAAIIEAAEAGVGLVVCVTERMPIQDVARVKRALKGGKTRLIGPNSYGVITPGQCRIGVMPDRPHMPGSVGIASRAATLAYEAVDQISSLGLGQSTSVGVGGDPVHGIGFRDCLELFWQDDLTHAVVLIGEIGGADEQEAAAFLKRQNDEKPVIAYVAGTHAPKERRMGHAGTVDFFGEGNAEVKIAALKDAGAVVLDNPSLIGDTVRRALWQRKRG